MLHVVHRGPRSYGLRTTRWTLATLLSQCPELRVRTLAGLHQLLRHHGPAPKIAHTVFTHLMDTIEYHPAGKEKKKVICFSPHPDDDVISMGGTLTHLVRRGNEVHVAYMTSGNIAVFDDYALQMMDFWEDLNRVSGFESAKAQAFDKKVRDFLSVKMPGQVDIPELQEVKTRLRRSEAVAAWDPQARPVPVTPARAGQAAVSEGCDVIVVDVAGPATRVLRPSMVWALAQQRRWVPAHTDPFVAASVTAALRDELQHIVSLRQVQSEVDALGSVDRERLAELTAGAPTRVFAPGDTIVQQGALGGSTVVKPV